LVTRYRDCLPSPAETPPTGPDWLHEIKHDGFRILALRDAAGVRLYTRNGNDFGKRFPLIVAAITALLARTCSAARASYRRTAPADPGSGSRVKNPAAPAVRREAEENWR
jgi:hypothetical protein